LTSRIDRIERNISPEHLHRQAACGEMRRRRPLRKSALLAVAVMASGPAFAQDMVYEPINPSFGGNPFNSAHLLGIANAQNDFKDPDSRTSSSQADIFARQLQSRLLSALSSQIVDAIFGENPQQQGTISFGGQTIDFFRDLDSVTLNITNDETGEVTEIVIPTFIEVN
jgi:curli production assembly/transport component CsgF